MDEVARRARSRRRSAPGTGWTSARRAGTPRRGTAARLPSLSAAVRVARAEVADRAQALGDLRDAELARLELLREMLEPVLAQVPPEVDLFDAGLVPGEHPRLFIDMVCFVEMARDRRSYRLVQDRRHARTVLHEGEGVAAAVAAVTAYIARRLVEREQLLASMGRAAPPARDLPRRRRAGARAAPRRAPPGRRRGCSGRRASPWTGSGWRRWAPSLWFGLHYAHGRLPSW